MKNLTLPPKISVLTTCYNSAQTIRYTLDSFFEQSYQNKEIIVLDGASIDRTLEIARSYPQGSMKIISGADKGMYDALNKGLAEYTGDGFGVLNSDDTYHHREVLELVAEGLRKSTLVQGHLQFVDDHQHKTIKRKWRATTRPRRGFKSGWMPAHPTFYARREVADRVGLFDVTMATAADYDWMIRAIDVCGFDLALIDSVMIDMMQGGRSTRSLTAYFNHNIEALAARQKWLNAGFVDFALVAKPLGKLGQFFVGGRNHVE